MPIFRRYIKNCAQSKDNDKDKSTENLNSTRRILVFLHKDQQGAQLLDRLHSYSNHLEWMLPK
jgi:hypothetical protein